MINKKTERLRNAETKRFFCFSAFLSLCLLFFSATANAQEWKEIKGEHFIIKFTQDEKFAKEVLQKAEVYYKKIASELGYQRYSNFWTWDKRVKIYIYPDKISFTKATGQPDWSEGMANYTNKEIISYAWSGGFLDALLPHEMAHLVFRDYVGFTGKIPLWMDEGVAQWMEPAKREAVHPAIKALLREGKILPLKTMMELDVREVEDGDLAGIFYVEAISLVGFLITEHSSGDFISFCRQLRDGKSVDKALTFTYATSMRSIEELEEEWQSYIRGE